MCELGRGGGSAVEAEVPHIWGLACSPGCAHAHCSQPLPAQHAFCQDITLIMRPHAQPGQREPSPEQSSPGHGPSLDKLERRRWAGMEGTVAPGMAVLSRGKPYLWVPGTCCPRFRSPHGLKVRLEFLFSCREGDG